MNKQTESRIRPINTEKKLMVAIGEGVGVWAKWVKWRGRCRPPVTERASQGNLKTTKQNK